MKHKSMYTLTCVCIILSLLQKAKPEHKLIQVMVGWFL